MIAAAAAVRRSLQGGQSWVQPQALSSAVRPDAYGSYPELVYFGIDDVDQALDCPASSHGCFYAFHDAEAEGASLPQTAQLQLRPCTMAVDVLQ